eukprot:jgi/Mesvir1/20488/Mv12375-RA.1
MVDVPKPAEGEALIKVLRAGVCNTDLEILRGYMGFRGTLGHEFVGIVVAVGPHGGGGSSSDGSGLGRNDGGDAAMASCDWIGQRVCGDINLACGGRSCESGHGSVLASGGTAGGQGRPDDSCDEGGTSAGRRGTDASCQGGAAACTVCDSGVPDLARNHCPKRSVLGILGKDGTYAQYLTLPLRNLHKVPPGVSDAHAVFAEPLAAAFRVVEQGLLSRKTKVAILGDGKLGLMICEVIGRQSLPQRPVLFGKHEDKMSLVAHLARTAHVDACSRDEFRQAFDVVVDATGSPGGVDLALSLLAPMGTLVLKSTCAQGAGFNNAPIVINEIRVVGSRCGPMDKALGLLGSGALDLDKYVTATYPLDQAQAALERAATNGCLKVHLVCS